MSDQYAEWAKLNPQATTQEAYKEGQENALRAIIHLLQQLHDSSVLCAKPATKRGKPNDQNAKTTAD